MKPILITFFVLTIFATCKKPEPYYPLSPEMRALATMKPGSYMVFEDSLHPGVRDSFWVNFYRDEVVRDNLDPKNIVQYDYINSTFEGSYGKIVISTKGVKPEPIQTLGFTYSSINNEKLYAGGFCATLPVSIGYTFNYNALYAKLIDFYEYYPINSEIFKNVYFIEGSYKDITYNCMYNKDNGLIRIESKSDIIHRIWKQTKSLILK